MASNDPSTVASSVIQEAIGSSCPGWVCYITKNGVPWADGSGGWSHVPADGTSSPPPAQLMSPDTIVQIGSISKPIGAVAMAALIDDFNFVYAQLTSQTQVSQWPTSVSGAPGTVPVASTVMTTDAFMQLLTSFPIQKALATAGNSWLPQAWRPLEEGPLQPTVAAPLSNMLLQVITNRAPIDFSDEFYPLIANRLAWSESELTPSLQGWFANPPAPVTTGVQTGYLPTIGVVRRGGGTFPEPNPNDLMITIGDLLLHNTPIDGTGIGNSQPVPPFPVENQPTTTFLQTPQVAPYNLWLHENLVLRYPPTASAPIANHAAWHNYDNINYELVGAVIEALTGVDYNDWVVARLFGNNRFRSMRRKVESDNLDVAALYYNSPLTSLGVASTPGLQLADFSQISAAGGFYVTAREFTDWMYAVYTGALFEGNPIVSQGARTALFGTTQVSGPPSGTNPVAYIQGDNSVPYIDAAGTRLRCYCHNGESGAAHAWHALVVDEQTGDVYSTFIAWNCSVTEPAGARGLLSAVWNQLAQACLGVTPTNF